MDKDNTKSTFMEYLIPLNIEIMLAQIKHLNLDKYVKKLDCITTTKLFVFAQLLQIKSYTDIHLKLNETQRLQQLLGLESISISQLSRKFRDMDESLLEAVFKDLVQQVSRRLGVPKTNQKLGRIHLIDSSTISLCLMKYRWAEFRKTKAGIKIHQRIIYCEDGVYPDEVVLTPAKPADKTQMDALVVTDSDALNIFDRGYVDYRKFDNYCRNNIRFVTRLKSNAIMDVIKENATQPNANILREAVVLLGDQKTYLMKSPLRLIECLDGEGNLVRILTNDFNLDSDEISELYRKRWQIELFFKWMKQHLHIKGCYGTSRTAVYNQIRIALITFCLTVLIQLNVSYRGSLFTVFKHVNLAWNKSISLFIEALFREPTRSSRGRRKTDHERIFAETLQQYEKGNIDHLNDMTYDPII
jgi:hypothetical protein